MKGNKDIINLLNEVLTNELTAINQYFLHARILQNWGLEKIGELEYHASIDEMKHADDLIKRILFLEGLPNVQLLNKITVGQNISEILSADLQLEHNALKTLRQGISECEKNQDYISRSLLNEILASEETHVDWLETQQELIAKIGEANYLQSQMKK